MKGESKFRSILLLAGGITAAGWLVYSRRIRQRIPGQEGLEDPQVTHAFNKISGWPQMRLLRRFAINRALNLVNKGEAIDRSRTSGALKYPRQKSLSIPWKS